MGWGMDMRAGSVLEAVPRELGDNGGWGCG